MITLAAGVLFVCFSFQISLVFVCEKQSKDHLKVVQFFTILNAAEQIFKHTDVKSASVPS